MLSCISTQYIFLLRRLLEWGWSHKTERGWVRTVYTTAAHPMVEKRLFIAIICSGMPGGLLPPACGESESTKVWKCVLCVVKTEFWVNVLVNENVLSSLLTPFHFEKYSDKNEGSSFASVLVGSCAAASPFAFSCCSHWKKKNKKVSKVVVNLSHRFSFSLLALFVMSTYYV